MPISRKFIHDIHNQLGIISGYCHLLLESMPASDPRYEDLVEIDKAARAAMALVAAERGDDAEEE